MTELMRARGIHMNSASPGVTDMLMHAQTDKESVSAVIPIGRFTNPNLVLVIANVLV